VSTPQALLDPYPPGTTVPQAILAATADARTRLAMLLGSHLEGGWGPTFSAGDGGTSFGPFQMHEGGALGNLPGTLDQKIAAAQDPTTAVAAMLPDYQGAVGQVPDVLWSANPEAAAEQAAFLAERPAQIYHVARGQQTVDDAYNASVGVLGGNPPVGSAGQGQVDTSTSNSLVQGAAGAVNGAGNVAKAVAKSVTQPWTWVRPIVVEGVLLLGGVALLAAGAWRAAAPARRRINDQAQAAAPAAAAAL